MPLRETLQTIVADYPKAKSEPLEGHALAQFIRHDAEDAVQAALGVLGAGLLVEGSPGQGNWAAVPWISVFDPAITTSATRGYYVVYLFHAHEPVVHLSLNQGTTAVREEFAGKAREVLADRAEFMRKRVAEYGAMLPAHSIDLGSTARLPGDYVAGHALGCSYALDALPAEAVLRTDLQNVVRAYRALTFRGGIEGDIEPQAELADEFKIPAQATIIETRKYAFHRKVERILLPRVRLKNSTAPAARPAISILKSVTAPSAKALLKRTISSRYQRWRRGSRLLTMWRPTLRCSVPTVTA